MDAPSPSSTASLREKGRAFVADVGAKENHRRALSDVNAKWGCRIAPRQAERPPLSHRYHQDRTMVHGEWIISRSAAKIKRVAGWLEYAHFRRFTTASNQPSWNWRQR